MSAGPATVLCEGASIVEARYVEHAGAVIAVNNAILLPNLRPDYWAVQDDLKRYDGVTTYRPPTVLLAGSFANAPGWWNGPWLSLETEPALIDLFQRGVTYSHALPTTVVAALWAVRQGYDPVTLYGCDMQGEGSPLTPWAPYMPDSTKWDERWARERDLVEHVERLWPMVRRASV